MTAETYPDQRGPAEAGGISSEEAVRRAAFGGFLELCHKEAIDLATTDARQGLVIATTMHNALSDALIPWIDSQPTGDRRQVFPAPPTTKRELEEFYRLYGDYGQYDHIREETRARRIASCVIVGQRYSYRYPEVSLASTLEDLLMARANRLIAVDSARVLQAAIGMTLIGRRIGGIVVRE